jgi:hypothetical protein
MFQLFLNSCGMAVTSNLRLLHLAREGIKDTSIKPWDMKCALERGYHQDIATISAYYHGDAKDLRAVIRCIRPVMEGYLRSSHHGQFAETEWFGNMIDKIRNATVGHPLESAKSILNDLESLNDYTKRYHHDDNSVKANSGQPQDGELQPFVKLALQLANRL